MLGTELGAKNTDMDEIQSHTGDVNSGVLSGRRTRNKQLKTTGQTFELGSNDRHRGKTHCCWTQNMLCLFTLLASQFFAVIMASSRCSAGVSPPDDRTPGG